MSDGTDFYAYLAEHYDQLFPFHERKQRFVSELLPERTVRLLDIGCATGGLLQYVQAHRPYPDQLLGLDLDPNLLRHAAGKLGPGGELHQADMRRVDRFVSEQSLDMVFCLGNTLPHLKDENDMRVFIERTRRLLRRDGRFAVQLVNYDRWFDADFSLDLPDIRTPQVTFQREYHRLDQSARIRFTGTITTGEGRIMSNSTVLYAVKKDDVVRMVRDAGFSVSQIYGDFSATMYTRDSPALVIVCQV